MFFKSLVAYRFNKPFSISTDDLEEKLAVAQFHPCGSQDMSKTGWVTPLGRHGRTFVHEAQGFQMICMNTEKKILPAPVIKERLAEKVAEIEEAQMRKVGRKEKEELKEQIIQELLPKAFTRSQTTYGYLSSKDGLLIIDASTPKKADDFTSFLRQTLGSLPIRMLAVKESPMNVMSEWLLGVREVPNSFELGDECELREQGDAAGVIRCKAIDLVQDEIRAHLEGGMRAVKLAMAWDEKITCMVSEDLTIKRIRFSDIMQEQAAEGADDHAARFDADFVLMATTFAELMPAILEAFGGEDKSSLQTEPDAEAE